MPAYLPPDLARLAIGLCVAQDQQSGGRGCTGWKNWARLVEVVNDETAVVQPANHKRMERVPIKSLRLWLKHNHNLGEEAMKRATLIDTAASMRNALEKKDGLRPVALAEIQSWLSNGENPIVLFRLRPEAKVPVPGRIIGMRGDNAVIRPIAPGSPPEDVPLDRIRIPVGVVFTQEDYNALELALIGAIGTLIPDKRDEPVKAVRQAVPAKVRPEPKPPAPEPTKPIPVPAAIAPPPPVVEPEEAPAIHGQMVKDGKAIGRGQWVVVDRGTKSFFSAPTGARWVKDITKAKVYEESGLVNRAAGRMGEPERDPEPMPFKQAEWFGRMWYPVRKPQPEALAPVPLPVPAAPEPVQATQEPNPPPVPFPPRLAPTGREAAVAKVREAIRDRAAAEAMALEAKAREVLARADLEMALLGAG